MPLVCYSLICFQWCCDTCLCSNYFVMLHSKVPIKKKREKSLFIFAYSKYSKILNIFLSLTEFSGRVLDSRPRGHRFEPHWCDWVVVLEQDTFILA